MSAALALPKTPTRGRLELRNVTKTFGDQVILDDVSLVCEPGEIVVVVGPSGCGKSTLLSLAAGHSRAEKGAVLLDGKLFVGPGPDRTMVFQEHGLFPWLDAADNVAFGLRMAGLAKSERDARVAEALAMVHLTHAAKKLVHELSGGMRQRVAIARALVMNPALLLMDEPFAALDAQTRTLLHEQLQDIWVASPKTILFVTHSVGEAVRLADRIVVMHAHPGRVRAVFEVNEPHPRTFDSPALSEIAHRVRFEIEDEVNRVRKQLAE
jgi:NitT/TauT family transport system ATP-binding protein